MRQGQPGLAGDVSVRQWQGASAVAWLQVASVTTGGIEIGLTKDVDGVDRGVGVLTGSFGGPRLGFPWLRLGILNFFPCPIRGRGARSLIRLVVVPRLDRWHLLMGSRDSTVVYCSGKDGGVWSVVCVVAVFFGAGAFVFVFCFLAASPSLIISIAFLLIWWPSVFVIRLFQRKMKEQKRVADDLDIFGEPSPCAVNRFLKIQNSSTSISV